MRILVVAAALALGSMAGSAVAQTRIDSINTNFRWLGPDDKVVVDRYDDPKVKNVSCYLSRAETGGVKGGLGLAEDPSRFSIACRAVGPKSRYLPICRRRRLSLFPPLRCSSRRSRFIGRSTPRRLSWSTPS